MARKIWLFKWGSKLGRHYEVENKVEYDQTKYWNFETIKHTLKKEKYSEMPNSENKPKKKLRQKLLLTAIAVFSCYRVRW